MAKQESRPATPKHKKRRPRQIITTRHDDGTYSHEHRHDDGKHNLFAGTSTNLEDVKQHIDDHFGPSAQPEAPEEQGEGGGPAGQPMGEGEPTL